MHPRKSSDIILAALMRSACPPQRSGASFLRIFTSSGRPPRRNEACGHHALFRRRRHGSIPCTLCFAAGPVGAPTTDRRIGAFVSLGMQQLTKDAIRRGRFARICSRINLPRR